MFSIPNFFRLSTAQIFVVQGRDKIHGPSKDAENTQQYMKNMLSSREASNFSAIFMVDHL